MKRKAKPVEPNYIVDENGKRVSVVLPAEDYTELLEDLSDLAAMAERRDDPSVDHAELIARLRADGLL